MGFGDGGAGDLDTSLVIGQSTNIMQYSHKILLLSYLPCCMRFPGLM